MKVPYATELCTLKLFKMVKMGAVKKWLSGKICAMSVTVQLKKSQVWGAWVAWSVKCPTPDLSSGHDLRLRRRRPTLGSILGVES